MSKDDVIFWVVTFALCLMLLGIGGCGIACCNSGGFNYSDGFRDGELQKFSRKGYIWKTWEGELALPAWKSQGEQGLSNTFDFSVQDDGVQKELYAMKPGEKLRVHYRQKILTPPWKGSTGYQIYKVEKVK